MFAPPSAVRSLLAILVLGPLPGCATAILWSDFDFQARETQVRQADLEVEEARHEITEGPDLLLARVRLIGGDAVHRDVLGGERALLRLTTTESHQLGGLDLVAATSPAAGLADHVLDGWHLELAAVAGPESCPVTGVIVLAGHGPLRSEDTVDAATRDAPVLPDGAWRSIAPEIERWQQKVAEAYGPRFLSLLPVAFLDESGHTEEPPRAENGVITASPGFRVRFRLRVLDRPTVFLEVPALLLGFPGELTTAARAPGSLSWEYRVPCTVTILPASTELPAGLLPVLVPAAGPSWLRHIATTEHFDWGGTAWRILLTPLALTLDVLGGALLELVFGWADEDEG